MTRPSAVKYSHAGYGYSWLYQDRFYPYDPTLPSARELYVKDLQSRRWIALAVGLLWLAGSSLVGWYNGSPGSGILVGLVMMGFYCFLASIVTEAGIDGVPAEAGQD